MILFLLFAAHFLIDFALQSDTMAVNKNRHANTELQKHVPWVWWMFSHAFIHGGAVAWLTNNVWLGLAEVGAHFTIDYWKCERRYDLHMDQMLHLWCKLIWAGITMWWMRG